MFISWIYILKSFKSQNQKHGFKDEIGFAEKRQDHGSSRLIWVPSRMDIWGQPHFAASKSEWERIGS